MAWVKSALKIITISVVIAFVALVAGVYYALNIYVPTVFPKKLDRSLPIGPFDSKSTAMQVTEGLDLRGKVAVVTGCTSGMGFEMLRVLTHRGVRVICPGRTLAKAQKACDRVQGQCIPMMMELTDFDSVVEGANKIQAMNLPLDMLILSAGINTFQDIERVNGIEKMFVANYLGHVVLVNRLLPIMKKAGKGRIVSVGSSAAYVVTQPKGIDFENLRGEKTYWVHKAYGRSKLAQILFTFELAKRLQGTGVTANALHPGVVHTNILRTASMPTRMLFALLAPFITDSVGQGAATQVYVATNPRLDGVSGAYFENCNPVIVEGNHQMYDRKLSAKLWQETERMTKGYLNDW